VRARLRSAKSPKTLIRRVAYESFQPQTDGFGICGRSTRRLRLFEEGFIDIEGLLHAYIVPYEYGYCIPLRWRELQIGSLIFSWYRKRAEFRGDDLTRRPRKAGIEIPGATLVTGKTALMRR
jgi:hypothetical protein